MNKAPAAPADAPAFLPYQRDPETLARPGRPGHGPAWSTHRWSREGRGHGQRQLRPGQPRADDPHPRRQGAPHRPPTSPRPRPTATRTACWWSLGAEPTARCAAPSTRPAPRASAPATSTSAGLNPFPPGLGALLHRYDRVLVPELNMGQLARVLRAEFLVDAVSYGKVQASPSRSAKFSPASRPSRPDPLRSLNMPPITEDQTAPSLSKKDFMSDQTIRLVSGCGDYSILSQVQTVFAQLGIPARSSPSSAGSAAQPLPLLHEHLRLPLHPRPGPRDRHRTQAGQPGAVGLGGDRRRRRAQRSGWGIHLITRSGAATSM